MSVLLSSSGRVKAGRIADHLAQAAEARKIYERLGASSARLVSAAFAGEAHGTWGFNLEFEDMGSFAEAMDRMANDTEAQEFALRMQEPDAPVVLDHVSTYIEVPEVGSGAGNGRVAAVFVSKPKPGCLIQAVESFQRVGSYGTSHGALHARLFTSLGSGSAPGTTLATFEFEDFRAFGRFIASFRTDPEGLGILKDRDAPEAPSTPLFEGVYVDVPI